MDTSVYVFYAVFSFFCSLIFLITFGAGLYSLYLTRRGADLGEEDVPKGRLAFLYNRKKGIWLLIIGLIFGIVGYKTQPTKMVHAPAKDASHEVQKPDLKKEVKPAKEAEVAAHKSAKIEHKASKPAVQLGEYLKLKKQLKSLQEENTELTGKIKLLEQELKRLKNDLLKKETENVKTHELLAGLKRQVNTLQKTAPQSVGAAGMGKQLQETCAQLKKAREESENLERQLNLARKQIKKATERNIALKTQIKKLQDKLEQTKQAPSALKKKLKNNEEKINALQKEKEELIAQLEKAKKAAIDLNKEKEALQQKLKAMEENSQTEKEALQKKIEVLTQKLKKAILNPGDAQKKLEAVAARLNALKAENTQLRNQLRALNDAINMKVIELNETQAKYQLLQEQAKLKDQKIKLLMQANKTLQDSIAFFKTRIDTLQSELKTKDTIIQQLQKKLASEKISETAAAVQEAVAIQNASEKQEKSNESSQKADK